MSKGKSEFSLSARLLAGSCAIGVMLAGCSQAGSESASASPEADMAATEAADAAGRASSAAEQAVTESGGAAEVTGADPSVAPGVAFAYHFNFRLPDDKVSLAQDAHIAACARLGQRRCQVTGLAFEKQEDGPVSGRITFLLEPLAARAFTRDAVDAVQRQDGELVNSQVNGEELAKGIEASQSNSAQMGGDLARIEARLRQPGLGDRERMELQSQAARLRGNMSDAEQQRSAEEDRLASTPVEFVYAGNTGIAGFDSSRPFASALGASSSSFGTAAATVMMLVGYALPWALMLGGIVLLWRFVRRRLLNQAVPATVPTGD